MHYIAYFGSVNQTYLPQDSVQNIIDIFLHSVHYTRFKLCSLHFPQPCTHSHPLLYIQVHLIRLHLNTSWKTRHLVISHITSEKSYLFPMCTQKNVHLVQFTKTDYENWALILNPISHNVTFFGVSLRCHGRSLRLT